jgi:DNA-binding transcriptional MerR regulator
MEQATENADNAQPAKSSSTWTYAQWEQQPCGAVDEALKSWADSKGIPVSVNTTNKEMYNLKRKFKYQTNNEYKNQVLSLNRSTRAEKAKITAKQARVRDEERQAEVFKAWKEVKASAGGETEYLTIGAFAKTVGRSVQSIRNYERRGIIPVTPHKSARGDRLYTPIQIMENQLLIMKAAPDQEIMPVERNDELRPLSVTFLTVSGQTGESLAFRIGVVAKCLGRTVLAIEGAEKKGLLPKTPFVDPKSGHRLYITEQIEGLKQAFDALGSARLRGEAVKQSFKEQVLASWGPYLNCKVLEVKKAEI